MRNDKNSEPEKCPNCDDVGWYPAGDVYSPHQEQCEFCYTNPNSIFNKRRNSESSEGSGE